MILGDIIAELRKDKGYTQKELSELLSVSVSTVSNYEKSVHYPDVDTLLLLADIFNVSVDYLLGRTAYSYNVNILHKPFCKNKKISDVIHSMLQLDAHHCAMLCEYMEMLTLHNNLKYRNTASKKNTP